MSGQVYIPRAMGHDHAIMRRRIRKNWNAATRRLLYSQKLSVCHWAAGRGRAVRPHQGHDRQPTMERGMRAISAAILPGNVT